MNRSVALIAAVLSLTAACGDELPPRTHGTMISQHIRPTDGDGWYGNGYGKVKVEHWDTPSGHFRVHYTREGKHAVPAADADKSSTPDFVEQFGKIFDQTYKAEITTMGFRPPLDDAKYHDRPDYGGDGRFDVYLQDLTGGADGYVVKEACAPGPVPRCAGYMVVENDFKGYSYKTPQDGMRVLASHEFFHTVQNAYRTGMASTFSEATAVWATEQVFPAQDDFEKFITYFFKNHDRSLDHALGGPSDSYPYALGIWPAYLAERFGAKVMPAIFEELSEKGSSKLDLDAIDKVLARDHKSSLAKAFAQFALWNYFTGNRAAAHAPGYKAAATFPQVKVTHDSRPLPVRLSGEIAYLAARYFQVQAKAGTWVQVKVERPDPKLALHLVSQDSGTKTARVVSVGPETSVAKIRSGGAVLIVAASTARKDRFLPLSLAVTETSGAPAADAGVPDSGAGDGGPPVDIETDPDCSMAGAANAGLLLPLALLLGLALRRTRRGALLLALLAVGLASVACSDDDPVVDSGVDAAADLGPREAGADAQGDGSGGDSSGPLAVGKFADYPADKAGVIQGQVKTKDGQRYMLLLLSKDTEALKIHMYTTSQPAPAKGKTMVRPDDPGTMTPPQRRCSFGQRLARVFDGKPAALWKPSSYQFANSPPQKGDIRNFNISNTTIKAEAVHVDGVSVFWLDKSTMPLATIAAKDLQDLADGFTKTIVPRERIYFGKESDLDSDGHISVLLSPLVANTATAYFSPCDLVDPKLVPLCANGNKMEMLYLSPPSSLKPPYNTASALLETVAHELQHLIYFNRKYLRNNLTTAKENPYITEGLSALAQDLSGYQAGNLYVVMATLKDTGLLSVPNLTTDAIKSYVSGSADGIMRGGGYLLLRYLFDRAGGDEMDKAGLPVDKGGIAWLRQYMDSKDLNDANFTGSTKLKLDELGVQFWTAMAVSNRGTDSAPINTDPRLNFRPTTTDPITKRQRGCDLFASFHGFKLIGPNTQTFTSADGKLRAGGAELLLLPPPMSGDQLTFKVVTPAAAKAVGRLIRLK